MATDIRKAIDSKFISSGKKFRSKTEKEKIYIYVEDDIDKLFWRTFITIYEDKYSFHIQTLQICDEELRGKSSLLSSINLSTLGFNKLICIDADLDLIIPDYCKYSEKILNNKYIITTILYSIESFKCYHKRLSDYVYHATLADNIDIDFEEIIIKYSNIIADLFLTSLVSISKKDHVYPMHKFIEDISCIKYSKTFISDSINSRIQQKIDSLKNYNQINNQIIEMFRSYLNRCGFGREHYYLLIKGHILMNSFIVPMLLFIIKPMRSAKISSFYKLNCDENRRNNLIAHYNCQTYIINNCCREMQNRIINLIDSCTIFEDCFAYENIKRRFSTIYDFE